MNLYEEMYRIIADSTYDWETWLGPDGNYIYISPSCERVTGYCPEDFFSNPRLTLEITHPDDRAILEKHFALAVLGECEDKELEFRIIHRDGDERWISHHCQPIYQSDGSCIGHRSSNRDITNLKRAEENLLESMETIKTLINAPTDIAVIIDIKGTILLVNDTLAKKVGKSVNELVGETVWKLFPPAVTELRKTIFNQLIQSGEPVRFENELALDVGPPTMFDAIGYPIKDAHGNITRIAYIGRDITERKQAENALQESMETIKVLINAPMQIAMLFDKEARLLAASEILAQKAGLSAGELIGKCIFDLFPPEVATQRKWVFEQVINSGEARRLEDRSTLGPSPQAIFDTIVYPIRDASGRVIQVAVLARDITERKCAEEALRQRDTLLRSVILNMPVVLLAVDSLGTITLFEGEELDALDRNMEVAVGQNAFQFFSNSTVCDNIRRALAGEEVIDLLKTEAGRVFETRYTPIHDSNDNIIGAAGVATNITEHIKAQEELRRSKDQLEVILHGVVDGIHAWGPSGKLIYANEGAAHLFGYPSAQALIESGNIVRDFEVLDESGKLLSKDRLPSWLANKGVESKPIEICLRHPDTKAEKWVIIKATPIIDENGKIQMEVIISHDITRLKQTQQELQKAHQQLEQRVQERTAELARVNKELNSEIAERRQAEGQARQKAAHAEALARLAARINAQLDLETVLNAICEETGRALNMPACSVMLYNEQPDAPHVTTAYGPMIEDTKRTLLPPQVLYESHLRASSPVIVIPDLSVLPGMKEHGINAEPRVRTVVSARMCDDSQLIGSLNAFSIGEIHSPSDEEVSLLQALANQATVAIKNARLFEQVSDGRERLWALSQRLVEVQEVERRHLARELHDEIGQSLTYLNLILEMVIQSISSGDSPPSNIKTELDRAQGLANQLLSRIRELSLDLRPALLDDLGLLPALLSHFEGYTEQTNIQVNFQHTIMDKRFPPEIETAAFRIIQEALTNIARHAGVNAASVRLWADDQMLGLQVEDQGCGFDPQAILETKQTSGLPGMRERATLCGGELVLETEPGSGTCLTAELPWTGHFQKERI